MSFLRYIERCNPVVTERFIPWVVDNKKVGWLRPAFVEHLIAYPEVLTITENSVVLDQALQTFEQRSEAMQKVNQSLADAGHIPPLFEPYPVTIGSREEALLTIDRAAAAYFGIRSFGQHINGYVVKDGQISMWIARRASDRLIYPGALDNMVAGGLPDGLTLQENLLKECYEEAAIPEALALKAQAVGTVSYNRVSSRGYRPDVLYCYDLELPLDFVPYNTDGEVEEFKLMPINELMTLVHDKDEFKLNCNLVIIDFCIRHGMIKPEDKDYLAITQGLHSPLVAPM